MAASLGLAVLAAGCGGSNAPGVPGAGSHNSNHTRASSSHGAIAQLLAYARCMRSHGISDFPDPTTTGGGISISQHGGPGSDLNPQSLAYRSAQQSCGHLLPAGGHGSAQPTAHDTAQMLHVSQCMRQHGIAGFPDPTQSSPSNVADYASDAVEDLGPSDSIVVLKEFAPTNAGEVLFGAVGIPRSIDPDDFAPNALQRRIAGQGGYQHFFHEGERAFCLYVILGSFANRYQVVPNVDRVLASITIGPGASS